MSDGSTTEQHRNFRGIYREDEIIVPIAEFAVPATIAEVALRITEGQGFEFAD